MKSSIKLAILLFLTAITFVMVSAQSSGNQKDEKLPIPAEEKFQEATELISPWRSSGCHIINRELNEPNCQTISKNEWDISDILTLYNEDGSVWYYFSVDPGKPEHFLREKKVEFLPFATYLSGPEAIILRMVGESPNWYEVEINEETRETKFVLKSDPLWRKTKWSYWLAEMKFFKFDDDQPMLLDKPSGKAINQSADLKWSHLKFLKTDGDWAYVEGYKYSNTYRGWIQWRQGRTILVKSFNGLFKVTKVKSQANN